MSINEQIFEIKPINKFGAPARGATVTLITNEEKTLKLLMLDQGICVKWSLWHMELEKDEKNFSRS